MDSLVHVSNVSKVYKTAKNEYRAINDVNLDIEKGQFISVMGPSGAGKSTLVNMISTLDRVTTGDIVIRGKSITKMNEDELCEFRRKEVGFIFQDCNLIDTLTIKENILESVELAGITFEEGVKKINELAESVNITSILDKFPSECSGGERQRAAACRALIINPSIIVADEPTGALDSKNSKELMELLKKLNKEYEVTILMVTHEALMASYSEKVLFIRDGYIDSVIEGKGLDQKSFYYKINGKASKEIENFI